MRKITALLALAAPILSACVDQPARVIEPYPFVGRWDCGVSIFTFTNTTYNNGSDTLPILSVGQDGRNYTLTFAGGYIIGLAAVTATGMTWVSSRSGDQFTCIRQG
ncbi:MAG: hypothetical protein HC844_09645 [Tabrizicola sp.]|nr:hypothetical protein [Tabrizicola sp.]